MIKVEKFVPGGQTLATASDGKKIFLWNALPGETISEFEITKQKSHFSEAVATKIDLPSPHRIPPKDSCFLSTSPWQILSWTEELHQKPLLVQEIFRQHQILIPIPTIKTDNQSLFYRNKMEYSLYWNHSTQKIELAFHARGSHRKIPIQKSSLEHSEIFTQAQKIIDDLNRNHAEAREFQSLLLRANQDGQVSGGLYKNHQPHPIFPSLSDTILNHSYQYSPNGFFQINLPVYELALKTIKKHLSTPRVLDLYSGVGTIGLSVAHDRNLTLVESDGFAFRELCHNLLSFNHLQSPQHPTSEQSSHSITVSTSSNTQLSAYLAKSENVLDFINPDSTIILDPPRAGCHPDLINRLLSVLPPTIIYLSCNPATQARDLESLLSHYSIYLVEVYNFFPRTPHIENLVILHQK